MGLRERLKNNGTEHQNQSFDFSPGWKYRIPGTYDRFKSGLRGKDRVTAEKLETLEEHFRGHYTTGESDFLIGTLRLATVLTQFNERSAPDREGEQNLRRRKIEVDGHRALTIEHPLTATMTMAGIRRDVKLQDSTGKKFRNRLILPVQQHSADVVAIAAMLLHDTLEDVTIAGIHDKDLANQMQEYYRGSPFAEDVLTVVKAVTNNKKGKETDMQKKIKGHGLHTAIVSDVMRLRPDASESEKEKIETEVAITIGDMFKMFEVCFGATEKPDKNKQYTEAALRNFYRAFAVKMHDIENNLETTTKDYKLVRAHTYAVMARVFGLPVATRMAAHLIAEQHYGLFGDLTEATQAQWNLLRKYVRLEKRRIRPRFFISVGDGDNAGRQEVRTTALQLPVLTAAEIMNTHDHKIHPALQFQIRISHGNRELSLDALSGCETITVEMDGKIHKARKMKAKIHELIRKSGRTIEYFEVEDKRGTTKAILKFTDDMPTVHDLLEYESEVDPSAIPETGFITGKSDELKGFDGTLESFLDIITEFHPHFLPVEI